MAVLSSLPRSDFAAKKHLSSTCRLERRLGAGTHGKGRRKNSKIATNLMIRRNFSSSHILSLSWLLLQSERK